MPGHTLWGFGTACRTVSRRRPPQLAYTAGMRCGLSAASLTCLRRCSAAAGVYGAPGPPSRQFRVASAQPLKPSLPAPQPLQHASRARPSGRPAMLTAGRRAAGGLHSGGEGAGTRGHGDRRHTAGHGVLGAYLVHLACTLVPGFCWTVGYIALPPLCDIGMAGTS